MNAILVSSAELRSYASAVLMAIGTPCDLAAVVAGALVRADLAGQDCHGVVRLPAYVREVRRGRIEPDQRPQVVHRRGVTATVSAQRGWGQPAARLAAETAAGIAHDGAGAVVLRDCADIGWPTEYAKRIAAHGQVGLVTANVPVFPARPGRMIPRAGAKPLVFAIPRGRGKPAIVSEFPAGVPESSPARGDDDHNLAIVVEVLGGVLSGARPAVVNGDNRVRGTLLVALDVASFCDLGSFFDGMARLAAAPSATPGVGGGQRSAALPGQPENETAARRQRTGIPIPEAVWEGARRLADELGIPRPQAIG